MEASLWRPQVDKVQNNTPHKLAREPAGKSLTGTRPEAGLAQGQSTAGIDLLNVMTIATRGCVKFPGLGYTFKLNMRFFVVNSI